VAIHLSSRQERPLLGVVAHPREEADLTVGSTGADPAEQFLGRRIGKVAVKQHHVDVAVERARSPSPSTIRIVASASRGIEMFSHLVPSVK
jgi:hypothetical protein